MHNPACVQIFGVAVVAVAVVVVDALKSVLYAHRYGQLVASYK